MYVLYLDSKYGTSLLVPHLAHLTTSSTADLINCFKIINCKLDFLGKIILQWSTQSCNVANTDFVNLDLYDCITMEGTISIFIIRTRIQRLILNFANHSSCHNTQTVKMGQKYKCMNIEVLHNSSIMSTCLVIIIFLQQKNHQSYIAKILQPEYFWLMKMVLKVGPCL